VEAERLAAIRNRLAGLGSTRWEFQRMADGTPPAIGLVSASGSIQTMRPVVFEEPAGEGDVDFIAHAPGDIRRLLAVLDAQSTISDEELTRIETRLARASEPPWRPFLESLGGMGGESVIWVSAAGDDVRDLYLLIDDGVAPDPIYHFVGEAPQDVEMLIGEVRARRK